MEIFGTDIDLNGNEFKKLKPENLLSFPLGPEKGRIIMHSGLDAFYGYDGSSWIDLGAAGTPYTLPIASEVSLGGVKIDGTTITINGTGIISAAPAIIASGLEELTENSNTGWRFIGETAADNINRYYVGQGAIDAMIFDGSSVGLPDVPALPYGTKSTGGINFGIDNKDNATWNSIIFGGLNQTNAYANATMIGTYNNAGYGYGDSLIGTYNTTNPSNVNSFLTAIGHNVEMNGERGGVGLGLCIVHNSRGAVVVGTSNVPWAGAVGASNRPAFTVGIGTTTTPAARWLPLVQKDGLNVLFSGEVIADSLTNALIDADSTGNVLVTRNWANDKLSTKSTAAGFIDVDWYYQTHSYTLTANTTLTESNLPATGYTRVITLYVTGSYTLTLPANWSTNQVGSYVQGVLNQVVVEYVSSGVYWVTITQPD